MILEIMKLDTPNRNNMIYRESAFKDAYDKIPSDKYLPITKLINDVFHDLTLVTKDKLKYDEKTKIVTLEIPEDVKPKIMGMTLVPKVYIHRSFEGTMVIKTNDRTMNGEATQKVAEVTEFSFVEFGFVQDMGSFPGLKATVRDTPVELKEDGVEFKGDVAPEVKKDVDTPKSEKDIADEEEIESLTEVDFSILTEKSCDNNGEWLDITTKQIEEFRKYLNSKKIGNKLVWAYDNYGKGDPSNPISVFSVGEEKKEDGKFYISFKKDVNKSEIGLSKTILSGKTLPILYKKIKKSLTQFSGIIVGGYLVTLDGTLNLRGVFYNEGREDNLIILDTDQIMQRFPLDR